MQRFARLGFTLAMFPHGAVFTFRVLAQQIDGAGGSSRLRAPTKEDGLQRFVRLGRRLVRFLAALYSPLGFSLKERRCRGVVLFRVPTKED